MLRHHSARSPKLSEEQRKLQKIEEEITRKKEEIEKKLTRLPAEIAEKKRKEAELIKLRSHAAAPAISLGGVRGSRSGASGRKKQRLPGQEMQLARFKFVVLCLVLGMLLFLLWSVIPG